MNGSQERDLRGVTSGKRLHACLAIGIALAFASAGCVGEPVDSDDDIEEMVDETVQELDGLEAPRGEEEGGFVRPGQSAGGPQPVPWRVRDPGDDDDDDSGPVVHNQNGSSSTPTGGHHRR